METVEEEYDARWPLALLVILTVTGAVMVGAFMFVDSSPSPRRAAPASSTSPAAASASPSAPSGLAVLHEWDRSRSRAWADGDVRALRGLYARGSGAGERDVAMLRSWSARGLRVEGLRMQVLSAREVRRTPSVVVLRVTDRVTGGVAVGRGVRSALPMDAASTRVIRLERRAGRWLVASVRRG